MQRYVLSSEAERDLLSIIRYTSERWGDEQTEQYVRALDECFNSLEALRVKRRFSRKFSNVFVQRCQHHYVFYWRDEEESTPVIIAILHEKMDLVSRLSDRLDG